MKNTEKNIDGKIAYSFAKDKLASIDSNQTRFYLCKFYGGLVIWFSKYSSSNNGIIETNKTKYAIIQEFGKHKNKKLNETRTYKQFSLLEEAGLISMSEDNKVLLHVSSLYISEKIVNIPCNDISLKTIEKEKLSNIVKPKYEIKDTISQYTLVKSKSLISQRLRSIVRHYTGLDDVSNVEVIVNYDKNSDELVTSLYNIYYEDICKNTSKICEELYNGKCEIMNNIINENSISSK